MPFIWSVPNKLGTNLHMEKKKEVKLWCNLSCSGKEMSIKIVLYVAIYMIFWR